MSLVQPLLPLRVVLSVPDGKRLKVHVGIELLRSLVALGQDVASSPPSAKTMSIDAYERLIASFTATRPRRLQPSNLLAHRAPDHNGELSL